MTDKCKTEGAEIVKQCEPSKFAIEREYIAKVCMVDMETKQKRWAFAITRKAKKHNTATLNFCPWCGSDVMTKYKDPINRSRAAAKE